MNKVVIYNGTLVLPDRVIENAWLMAEDGKITEIGGGYAPFCESSFNAQGRYVMPGFVDIHSDAIEKEIEPRPNSVFPMAVGMFALEARLLSHGVTTIFHSLSLMNGDDSLRSRKFCLQNIEEILALRKKGSINHLVHARYEMIESDFAEDLIGLIEENKVDMVSFMDHTPGQGQYKNAKYLKEYLMNQYGMPESEAQDILTKRMARRKEGEIESYIYAIAEAAVAKGIPIASHDDDTNEKISSMLGLGVSISEFPINIETARFASSQGLHVAVGAPNIVRGVSTSGNMKAIDAITDGCANIICSDYMPPAMIHSVFTLFRKYDVPLHKAVAMVTSNPAQAAKLPLLGRLEPGCSADIVIVEELDEIVTVELVLHNGKAVFARKGGLRDFLGARDNKLVAI